MTQKNGSGGPVVECKRNGAVATIWLNRPEAYNAVTAEICSRLKEVTSRLEADDTVHAVIVRGRGRQFSAGGDMAMFSEHMERIGPYMKGVISDFHEAVTTLRRMPKPTIAVIHGAAAGGGLALALACDFVISDENTKLAIAYRRLGATSDGGMVQTLVHALGTRRALSLMLLSDVLTAQEALSLGLVSQVAPSAVLEEVLDSLTATLLKNAPRATAAVKNLVYRAPATSLEEHLTRELAAFIACADTNDFREGINAFTERRKPVFTGK